MTPLQSANVFFRMKLMNYLRYVNLSAVNSAGWSRWVIISCYDLFNFWTTTSGRTLFYIELVTFHCSLRIVDVFDDFCWRSENIFKPVVYVYYERVSRLRSINLLVRVHVRKLWQCLIFLQYWAEYHRLLVKTLFGGVVDCDQKGNQS